MFVQPVGTFLQFSKWKISRISHFVFVSAFHRHTNLHSQRKKIDQLQYQLLCLHIKSTVHVHVGCPLNYTRKLSFHWDRFPKHCFVHNTRQKIYSNRLQMYFGAVVNANNDVSWLDEFIRFVKVLVEFCFSITDLMRYVSVSYEF